MKSKKHDWNNDMLNAWKNYKPPVRPSKYDLAVFRKFLEQKIKKKGRNVKVLILGSTPELRDLVSSKKLTAYVCDHSRNNYDGLKLLKKVKGKEVLINQDWSKLRTKQRFDLVFAEASLNMLKKSDMPKVLKNVKNVLKTDGLFITKTWTRIPKNKLCFRKIINLYRKKHSKIKFKPAMSLYNYSYAYDIKKDHVSVKQEYLRMKGLYEAGRITKKEFGSFSNLGYQKSPLKVYLPLKKEFISIAKKHMRLLGMIMPKPIGANKIMIYVLGK